MAPILSMGDPILGETFARGFSLQARSYRGRVGAPIPTGGIVLPAAKNGAGAITYATSNLPSGLSFAASTRAITGNPTTAHATREVTYTATDSSTPAEVVTAKFEFPIVSATAGTNLDDWDNRGYGLTTRKALMVAVLASGANVGTSDVNVWAVPPRGTIGAYVVPTQAIDLVVPGSDPGTIITRIRLHPGSDAFTLNHSNTGPDGGAAVFSFSDWHTPLIGSRSLWLQWRGDADEYPLASGDSAGGGFLRVSTAADSVQSSLDDNQHFILALTDTS